LRQRSGDPKIRGNPAQVCISSHLISSHLISTRPEIRVTVFAKLCAAKCSPQAILILARSTRLSNLQIPVSSLARQALSVQPNSHVQPVPWPRRFPQTALDPSSLCLVSCCPSLAIQDFLPLQRFRFQRVRAWRPSLLDGVFFRKVAPACCAGAR
jgi:hypothetical protein